MPNSITTPPFPGGEKHPIFKRFDKENLANLSNYDEGDIFFSIIILNKKIQKIYENLNESERLQIRRRINHIFYKVEDLFGSNKRSSGDPYFYHLLETAFIRIEESYHGDTTVDASFIDIFLALLHDTIEDTHVSLNGLRENFGDELSFGVHLISKQPFATYIEDDEESEKYLYYIHEIRKDNISLDEKIVDESQINEEVRDGYKKMRTKYRAIRNTKHYSNYASFETFYNFALEESKELQINLSEEKLREICYRVLQVKLCDRLHNLRTIGHLSWEQIEKKVVETEKYFLHLADEINLIMAKKIRDVLEDLKKLIEKKRNELIVDEVSRILVTRDAPPKNHLSQQTSGM